MSPGSFEAFFENQEMLPPANKAKYILLMAADLHNVALMDAYHEDVNTAISNSESPTNVTLPDLLTPEQFVESNEVFGPLLLKKGMKSKLIASRKDQHNELLRRKPDAFTARLTENSKSNTTINQYMRELTKFPLTDPGDISFIKRQLTLIQANFEQEAKSTAERATSRMTFNDRLRYILIFEKEESVLAAYLSHTNGLTRDQVDYQGSDKAPPNWTELHCECFNDPMKVYETAVHPNLHDRYSDVIVCEKGLFELTADKSKSIMQGYKTNLRGIINKYNASGNGADMAKHDCDEDDVGGAAESEETYGRFNSELAKKRAELKGEEDLLLMDGDDRKNFIGMNSVDVLYWWDVMDRLSMIFMFMGKLHDGISASSNRTPASTARRRAGDETNSNTQSNKKSKSGRDDMQRELVRNVGEINKSMSVVALALIHSFHPLSLHPP